jgi:acetyl esterase/lipase
VGGASAGGNLAAGAVLRLRDEDDWLPKQLLLAYSVLHPVLPSLPANQLDQLQVLPSLLRFSPHDVRSLITNYLGGPPSTADGYAMPGIADLEALCPTIVINAEYDDLRASGQSFASRLALAGVETHQVVAPGMLHGFLARSVEMAPVREAIQLIADSVGNGRGWKPTGSNELDTRQAGAAGN